MTTGLHSDRIRPKAGPRWLYGRVAQGLLFSLTVPLDAITEWMYQGVVARFPGLGPEDADGYVQRDRGIYRGPTESRAAWAIRARKWLAAWRRAGSPFAVLEQVQSYFSPAAPWLRLVTDSGHWYTRDPNGNEIVLPVASRPPAVASNWTWDSWTGIRWWRVWLIVYLPAGFATPQTWDGGVAVWDGSTIWDGVPKAVLDDLVTIAKAWLPAHAKLSGLIVTTLQPTDSIPGFPGVHPFDPTSTAHTYASGATTLPLGQWDVTVYPSGAYMGHGTRAPWATFYAIT